MPSSVTIAVPSGPIQQWCLAAQIGFDDDPYQCANETLGQKESDFSSICCDGDIIDTTMDLWKTLMSTKKAIHLDLDNLACCRLIGAQQGGLSPIDPNQKHCTAGTPTPLASLAATNTKNAEFFRVTYTSASGGGSSLGDYIPTDTPTCFWMGTKSGQAMQTVTVEAASIKTLPPETTDHLGFPIGPTTELNTATPGTGTFDFWDTSTSVRVSSAPTGDSSSSTETSSSTRLTGLTESAASAASSGAATTSSSAAARTGSLTTSKCFVLLLGVCSILATAI